MGVERHRRCVCLWASEVQVPPEAKEEQKEPKWPHTRGPAQCQTPHWNTPSLRRSVAAAHCGENCIVSRTVIGWTSSLPLLNIGLAWS